MGDFEPSWMLKVTWEGVPASFENNNRDHTNTFQGILLTDGVFSFCISIFQRMNWQISRRAKNANNALMGYHTGVYGVFYNNEILSQPAEVRYKPENVTGNTGVKGIWVYRLENNSLSTVNSKKSCLNWVNHETMHFWDSTPCPCSYWQGMMDMEFIDEYVIQYYGYQVKPFPGAAYTLQSVWQNPDRSGVRCYYDWQGSLITGQHEGLLPTPWNPPISPWSFYRNAYWFNYVYFQMFIQTDTSNYYTNEVKPYKDCCLNSGDNYFCSLYQTKRPAVSCWNYRPPWFGWMFGDPHITTLDGVDYTFNGLGEYDLLIANDGNVTKFIVQGRTQRAGDNHTSMATNFVALVAMQTGCPMVEWKLDQENTTLLYIEGYQFSVSENATTINGTTVMLSNGSTVASFKSGVSVTVTATMGALQFLISLPEKMRNNTQGLLGIFNGNKTDDFTARNGTILPFNGDKPPKDNRIFFEFGQSWKITNESSLFSYVGSESWLIFNNNTFVPRFFDDLLTENTTKTTEITALCNGSDACIFDALSTGNIAFALQTKKANSTFERINTVVRNSLPNITGSPVLETRVKEAKTIKFNITDLDGDKITLSISSLSPDINITADGVVVWLPTSSQAVFASVVATDGVRAPDGTLTPTLMPLNLTLCNCSANSTCLFSEPMYSVQENQSIFQVAGCNCSDGYTGQFCDENLDACATNPCYPGINCTDLPPPSLGYKCAPCPAGYTGDGENCLDIDECNVTSPCGGHGICSNSPGSFSCSCFPGYRDPPICRDIDECAENTSICNNATENCLNKGGNYSCNPKPGLPGNKPPTINGSTEVKARLNESTILQITVVDPESDPITLTITPNSSDFTIYANGSVGWRPSSTREALVWLVASDGGNSSRVALLLTVCNCSRNAACNFSQPQLSNSNDSPSFQVASCLCSSGYAGTYCDQDYDACGESPCFTGVTCTDLPAPSLNFTCGPCPVGYRGNGRSCLGNKPPTINGSTEVKARLNESTILQITVVDPESDPITLTITPNSSDFTIYANGSVGWRPSSTREALVWLVASDGGNSSRVALSLTVCNCSRNAACNFSQPQLSNSNDSPSFQVASCLCSSGYAGTYCDQDYDACGESPCFTGVTCTDLPAPSLNFMCGPCPVGYRGNGRSCLDIDECNVTSPCGGHGNCSNSPGSFSCSCFPGYRGTTACLDIDECAEQPNSCSSSQLCVNTLGSFQCNCKLGVSDGICSLVCPGLTCPESYCNKHGTCSLNTTTCKQQCACGDSYKGDNCQNGKEIFQAKLKYTELNAVYQLNLTFEGETYDDNLMDNTNSEYARRRDSYIRTVTGRLSSVSLFYYVSLKRFINQGNKVMLTEMTAKYNYTPTKDVIMFYDSSLMQTIRNSFNKTTRSTNVVYLNNLAEDTVVPRDVLPNYYSCDTDLNGYVIVFDSAQGFICKSPCSDTNYCKNGGTCQHLATGVQCKCPANFNGQFCENDVTGVSHGVFFGVLFGVLGGLLLLLLGLLAFCLCKKNNSSLFDDKHSILRSSSRGSYVPWLSSMNESTLQGNVPGITLKGLKTKLDNIDISSKIFTKRPTIVHPKPMDQDSMSSQ
nr:mucin-4-like isoform X1 [Petromyzon marinus]